MARLGLGLIGTGKHGSRYAQHIVNDFPELRLAAIARRNRTEAAQQSAAWQCRAYDDYHDLVADAAVEAVIVVTPPTLHPEIIAAVCAARKPVLLEKPAAATVAAGLAMLAQTRAARIPAMVAQTLRFNGVVRALLAARERIGRIHSLRIGQRFEPSRPGWIDDIAIAGGGMTLHTGVHCFDLVRLLSGAEITRVAAAIRRVGTVRTENNFAATLELGADAGLATVAGSRVTASRSGGIEVAGEHGQLVGDHVLNSAFELHAMHLTPLPLPPAVATVREVIAAFTDALRRGAAMPISLEDGLRAVAVAEACYTAADSGRWQDVARIE